MDGNTGGNDDTSKPSIGGMRRDDETREETGARDSPRYGKYFGMLGAGIPEDEVWQEMFDGDLDHDALAEDYDVLRDAGVSLADLRGDAPWRAQLEAIASGSRKRGSAPGDGRVAANTGGNDDALKSSVGGMHRDNQAREETAECEGRVQEIGVVEAIADEGGPIFPPQFGRPHHMPKIMKAKAHGSVELAPVSSPLPDSLAAMVHDDSLELAEAQQRKKRTNHDIGVVEAIADEGGPIIPPHFGGPLNLSKKIPRCREISPPLPDSLAAMAHGDPLDLAEAQRRKKETNHNPHSTIEPEAEAENLSILPRAPPADSRAQNALGTPNRANPADAAPAPDARTIYVDVSPTPPYVNDSRTAPPVRTPRAAAAEADDDVLSASVRPTSPYVNDSDEIVIPEATRVDSERIPRASVVRPEKYSLTVAGRKVRFLYVALGGIAILGVVVGLAVTLTKTKNVEDPVLLEPSSAPSESSFPTLDPSTAPSSSPTSALQAELVGIISNYSGGDVSSSISKGQSKHRVALDWLIRDQSKWREENRTLPDVEIVERFVLALIYYETHGPKWYNAFQFTNNEHVCLWRGYLDRFQKGIIRCTRGRTGRVTNLTLWENNLQGQLPTEIGLLQELTALHIGRNRIEGKLPETLGSLTSITNLELNDNNLAGPINSLSGLAELELLDLSSNQMTGSLVHASNLTKLEILKANRNQFSGSVPKSFSSLDILHLQSNQLSGNAEFLCQASDYEREEKLDYELDCKAINPKVECNCCMECSVVNDTACDPVTEKAITMNIRAGNNGNNFEWHLRDEDNNVLIAADGDYPDGHQLNVYLCLTFPRWYSISTSAPSPPTLTLSPTYPATRPPPTAYDPGSATNTPIPFTTKPPIPFSTPQPTGPPAGGNEAGISFFFDGYKSSIGPNGREYFSVTEKPTLSPTGNPTSSARPTSSSRPTAPTNSPVSIEPTEGATPTVGYERTDSPTIRVTRPPPCDYQFELRLITDSFGMDTGWELSDRNSNTVIVSENGFASNQTLVFDECLDTGRCYDFIIKDAWDDGICCGQGKGSYHVSINGRLIGSGGEFGSSETVFLGGNCGAVSTEAWPLRPTWRPWQAGRPTANDDRVTPFPTTPFPTTPYPITPFPTETPSLATLQTTGPPSPPTLRPTRGRGQAGGPMANDDRVTMNVDDIGFFSVLDNDTPSPGEELVVVDIVVDASNGQCEISLDLLKVAYTPDVGFVGIDSCVYEACDTLFECSTAMVTVTVEPP